MKLGFKWQFQGSDRKRQHHHGDAAALVEVLVLMHCLLLHASSAESRSQGSIWLLQYGLCNNFTTTALSSVMETLLQPNTPGTRLYRLSVD